MLRRVVTPTGTFRLPNILVYCCSVQKLSSSGNIFNEIKCGNIVCSNFVSCLVELLNFVFYFKGKTSLFKYLTVKYTLKYVMCKIEFNA